MFAELIVREPSQPSPLFSEKGQQHENRTRKMNGLAIHIRSFIASIPETSGTRAAQMLAIIIAAVRYCAVVATLGAIFRKMVIFTRSSVQRK